MFGNFNIDKRTLYIVLGIIVLFEISGYLNNPQELLNQITNNYSPEQKAQFIKFANGYGVSNEQLSKYGIDAEKH